jgi:hypothetical protein
MSINQCICESHSNCNRLADGPRPPQPKFVIPQNHCINWQNWGCGLTLRDLQPQIVMDEGIRLAAKKSLDRMLEMASATVGKGDLGRA